MTETELEKYAATTYQLFLEHWPRAHNLHTENQARFWINTFQSYNPERWRTLVEQSPTKYEEMPALQDLRNDYTDIRPQYRELDELDAGEMDRERNKRGIAKAQQILRNRKPSYL